MLAWNDSPSVDMTDNGKAHEHIANGYDRLRYGEPRFDEIPLAPVDSMRAVALIPAPFE